MFNGVLTFMKSNFISDEALLQNVNNHITWIKAFQLSIHFRAVFYDFHLRLIFPEVRRKGCFYCNTFFLEIY